MILSKLLTGFRKKASLGFNMLFGKTVRIYKRNIKIPVICGRSLEPTEPWLIDLLTYILPKQSGTFLDIGVNLGQTLIKVKAIELKRKYVGFEPNAACVFYVNELIKLNDFDNCTIFPIGLFTKDAVLFLECISDTEVDSAASLIENFRPDHKIFRKIPAAVFRFERIVGALNLESVGIVKIDVEGAELEVVKSLLFTLTEQRPVILIEILPVYTYRNEMRIKRQEELELMFANLGYVFLRVNKSTSNTMRHLERINSIGVHSDLDQCDYLLSPNELAELFEPLEDITTNKRN